MFSLDNIVNENNEDHNKKCPCIPGHPYGVLVIRGSGSGKTNSLFNRIRQQDSNKLIDNIYFYAKDLNEPKFLLLIKKREETGVYLYDQKAFIEYSNTMNYVYNIVNDLLCLNFEQVRFWTLINLMNNIVIAIEATRGVLLLYFFA